MVNWVKGQEVLQYMVNPNCSELKLLCSSPFTHHFWKNFLQREQVGAVLRKSQWWAPEIIEAIKLKTEVFWAWLSEVADRYCIARGAALEVTEGKNGW